MPAMPWNSHSMKVHSSWLENGTTGTLRAFFSCCCPLSPCTKDEAITAKMSVHKAFCTVQGCAGVRSGTQLHYVACLQENKRFRATDDFQPIGSTAT